mmetsp:Transcript_27943/g.41261  ORF Transcript_27943/g.41261 Transcript_27943/m.41261 type:complete len:224 (-) Transcript_27943:380-1051(-)
MLIVPAVAAIIDAWTLPLVSTSVPHPAPVWPIAFVGDDSWRLIFHKQPFELWPVRRVPRRIPCAIGNLHYSFPYYWMIIIHLIDPCTKMPFDKIYWLVPNPVWNGLVSILSRFPRKPSSIIHNIVPIGIPCDYLYCLMMTSTPVPSLDLMMMEIHEFQIRSNKRNNRTVRIPILVVRCRRYCCPDYFETPTVSHQCEIAIEIIVENHIDIPLKKIRVSSHHHP